MYSQFMMHGQKNIVRLSQTHDHSATGRIISIKNSNGTIGNRRQ